MKISQKGQKIFTLMDIVSSTVHYNISIVSFRGNNQICRLNFVKISVRLCWFWPHILTFKRSTILLEIYVQKLTHFLNLIFFKFFFVLLICTDNNAAPQEKNHLLSDIIPRSPWNGYVLDITRVAKMAKNWWRRDMSRIWICWECQNGPIFFLNGLFWHSRDRKWAISAFSAHPYAWFTPAILDHFSTPA